MGLQHMIVSLDKLVWTWVTVLRVWKKWGKTAREKKKSCVLTNLFISRCTFVVCHTAMFFLALEILT